MFKGRRGNPLTEDEKATNTLHSGIRERGTRLWKNESNENGDCPDDRTEASNTAQHAEQCGR